MITLMIRPRNSADTIVVRPKPEMSPKSKSDPRIEATTWLTSKTTLTLPKVVPSASLATCTSPSGALGTISMSTISDAPNAVTTSAQHMHTTCATMPCGLTVINDAIRSTR